MSDFIYCPNLKLQNNLQIEKNAVNTFKYDHKIGNELPLEFKYSIF